MPIQVYYVYWFTILLCLCAEYLNQNADMFQRTATRLKRKLWWQNVKLWIILIVIILVILAVIISEYGAGVYLLMLLSFHFTFCSYYCSSSGNTEELMSIM